MRCCLSLNRTYSHGPRHQQATIRIEDDRGAAQVSLGLLLNYPEGEPETLEIVSEGLDWTPIPLNGRWFPDAFIGVMSNLQRYADGDDETLITSVEDAFGTMALVDACIRSNIQEPHPSSRMPELPPTPVKNDHPEGETENHSRVHLQPTPTMNFEHREVQVFLKNVNIRVDSRENVVRLYYAVRDSIRYDPYTIELSVEGLRASTTIAAGRGWCISTAILLSAL